MRRNSFLIATVCLLAAGGCSFMAPQPDRTQYFILSPAASVSSDLTPASAPASTSRLSIGLGPIRFPDYLKRPWVVTRAASNRLLISDSNRWAEPLDRNFEGTLSQNLSSMLGTQKIVPYPWYADTHIDYQVAVWVSRFETSEDGHSQLSAVWTINNGQNGNELASGQANVSVPVQSGDAGASAALSQDLAEMSRQIADRIAQLSAIQKSGAALFKTPAQHDRNG
jgi:uncharacterized lipoprotein YmbA